MVKQKIAAPTDEPVHRAHCSYCGGKGDSAKAETVLSPLGLKYRIPVNHESCKQSVLSLSLSLSRQFRQICRRPQGVINENRHALVR